MPNNVARPCQKCGMPIEFLENAKTGNTIPAQRIRTLYVEKNGKLVKLIEQGMVNHNEQLERHPNVYVSHFETCPHAGSFSKRGREKATR